MAGPSTASSAAAQSRTRAREREAHDHAAVGIAGVRAEGDAAARRLQPDQAAERGGIADRAAAVAAVGERHDAGGDRGGRTAARAGGRAREVPGIARRAGVPRHREGGEAELGGGGAAEIDQAGLAEALHQHAVARGREAGGELRAHLGLHAGLDGEVLHQEGHAGEGAVGGGAESARSGKVSMTALSCGLSFSMACSARLAELAWRDFLAAHEIGEAEAVVGGVFG